MKKWMLLSAIAVLFVTSQSSAQSSFVVRARLSGLQEVPALSTPARGDFVARVGSDRIVYRLSYSGFPTTANVAHIHFGAQGTNGGVAAFLCGGSGKPTCPPTEGEVAGTIVPSDVVGPSGQGISAGEFDELARIIRAGFAYANVHSTQFGGGEIRGQLRHDEAEED